MADELYNLVSICTLYKLSLTTLIATTSVVKLNRVEK